MTNPESPISQDAALSSFMSAAIGDPETSRAAPEDNTVTRTGNTADHQDGWFAGIDHGRAEARDIAAAAHSAPALAAPAVRNWKPVQAAIDDYLGGYELRLDEGCHTPTEFERFLLVDAVAGLMEDDGFIGAMLSAIAPPAAAPAAGNTRTDRDAAFEAVRKRLCALPRYSFWIGDQGGVKRVEDRSGAWIDFDAAHELFDPVAVDVAIAAQQGKGEAA